MDPDPLLSGLGQPKPGSLLHRECCSLLSSYQLQVSISSSLANMQVFGVSSPSTSPYIVICKSSISFGLTPMYAIDCSLSALTHLPFVQRSSLYVLYEELSNCPDTCKRVHRSQQFFLGADCPTTIFGRTFPIYILDYTVSFVFL